MIFIYAFLFSGIVCLIGQLLIDGLKMKPGIVTSLFVFIGSFLDLFDIYDFFVNKFGAGAMVVITSFGHLLTHGVYMSMKQNGLIGLFTGAFTYTTAGIVSTIIFSFIIAIIFKPKS